MKETRRKLVVIMVIIIILLITGMTIVQADTINSFKATVTPESKTIKAGEEIIITLKISEINMGEDGINAVEGTIKYDKEVFEKISSSSIQAQNNWTTTLNDESSTLHGKFLSFNMAVGVKEDTDIFTITLKAKQDIEETTNTQINFKDITSNNGADLINAGTKNVDVIIEPTTSKTETSSGTSKVNSTQSGTNPSEVGKNIFIGMIVIGVVIIVVCFWKKKMQKR